MTSARVCRLLREEILCGTLRPGARLVRRAVAKRLGVSPIPVIEALHMLEKDGLVENEAMRGARVRGLSMDDVLNDIVLREAIESQIARLLAERVTDDQIRQLYEKAEAVDELMSRREPTDLQGMETHMDFHLTTARMTGYPVLLQEERKVWTRWFMQFAWISAAITPVPRDWHRQWVTAVASRDVQRADAAARYHILRSPEEHERIMKDQAAALEKLREMSWPPQPAIPK